MSSLVIPASASALLAASRCSPMVEWYGRRPASSVSAAPAITMFMRWLQPGSYGGSRVATTGRFRIAPTGLFTIAPAGLFSRLEERHAHVAAPLEDHAEAQVERQVLGDDLDADDVRHH